MDLSEIKIAIIGLGYVGLPLALAFAEKYPVIGFDINISRINELKTGYDKTLEVDTQQLKNILNIDQPFENGQIGLRLSTESNSLIHANIFIVTVPTPIDRHNRPVLIPMINASKNIAKYLKKGDIVIYESTVYPGVTEDEMAPILEYESNLKYNVDFFCGYSPERINPGDKDHTIKQILKITSGSTPKIAVIIDQLYRSIITAGTFMATSIKVAEAAKVIENTQRDLNIAFVNELSKIFKYMNIDTNEVLNAAGTKWNFLKFKPGLVGGHCIGVDPYYLAQKAQEAGYHPEIILAGRRMNDSMGVYVATEVIKLMLKKGLKIIKSNILILGITFKENCPDVRNTRVTDIYNELINFDMNVEVFDSLADPIEVFNDLGIKLLNRNIKVNFDKYSAIILAVPHDHFLSFPISTSKNRVIFDVKGVLPKSSIDQRL